MIEIKCEVLLRGKKPTDEYMKELFNEFRAKFLNDNLSEKETQKIISEKLKEHLSMTVTVGQ